jgi:hypothetical protein
LIGHGRAGLGQQQDRARHRDKLFSDIHTRLPDEIMKLMIL